MPNAQPEAPRNIILLSDGTGNSAASLFKTNVRRLHEALDVADPATPAEPRQFAFYDDGVGTSTFRPLALVGGAFGHGLARNVRELYTSLCRIYRPGDRIYAFGFSRGAFTIRILVGLIMNQGILKHEGSEAALARAVRTAYREYRRDRHKKHQILLHLRPLRDQLIRAWHALTPIAGQTSLERQFPERIEFVGVWDTVDAYGLPIEELVRAIDRFILPLGMADADLNPKVHRARQALALDEERQTFHPRLWNEFPNGRPERDPERIRQVWFAGVHADVGGGYPDDGLAHVTLDWMLSELEAADRSPQALRLKPGAREQIRARADENAPLHDSRRGLASYYRYRPRDIEILRRQRTLQGAPFNVRVHKPLLHESVLRRIRVGHDGYAPISSTLRFDVALIGGGTQPLAAYRHLAEPPQGEVFKASRAWVFNLVWWRRITYFLTLFITLGILAFPAWLDAEGCSSWACFLSPLIQAAGGLLPGALSGWVATAASNPATLLVALGLFIALHLAGNRLDGAIRDRMRQVWSSHSGLPALGDGLGQPEKPGAVNAWVQRLRTDRRYIRFWNVARRCVLPACAGAAALYLLGAVVSNGVMSAAESAGWVCDRRRQAPVFETSRLCAPAGAEVVKDGRYEIELRIPAGAPWKDASLPAGPNGLTDPPLRRMALLAPLRRHWGQPWFKLMVRIGERGADSQALDWQLVSSGTEQVYRAVLTANRTGPLFLYVNDAVPVIWPRALYIKNEGEATVSVHPLSLARPPGAAAPQSSFSTSPAR